MKHSISARSRRAARGLRLAPALALLALLFAPPSAGQAPAEGGDVPPSAPPAAEKEGVEVTLDIDPLDGDATLAEGDVVRVRFKVADTASGAPLAGLYPAAWMDRVPARARIEGESCREKVSTFLGGGLLAQPELNLNVYYVLALNDDATITVVDPLFGFGNTKLLALVELEARGEDWVLGPDERRLYVSMPAAGKVAVVDTEAWKVAGEIALGFAPTRLALTADGRQLWVADDGRGEGSGVAVYDTRTLERTARIATGAGAHDLVLDPRERFAYVSNRAAGTVSVIDARTLEPLAAVRTGSSPAALAYSPSGGAAYVVDPADGTVTVLGADHAVAARIEADPGLGELAFEPAGRYGFLVNPANDKLYIIDASRQRIVQVGKVEAGPHQVTFSDELAYVRHLRDELVLMVPLDVIGEEGTPISVVDFPGGQRPPAEGVTTLPAPSIVQAPGAPAVLVANPADKIIYFYKEGMAAPMGSFRNYDRQPLAVQVVDRSLRERTPGHYETTVQLRRPGTYDVAFFLDAPRLVHCFELEVAPDPARERARRAALPKVRIEPLIESRRITVGEPVELRFRLADTTTGEPVEGIDDLRTLTFLGPGLWQERKVADHRGDGVYGFGFTPPRPGLYYVFLASASLGIELEESRYVLLDARPAAAATAEPPESASRR